MAKAPPPQRFRLKKLKEKSLDNNLNNNVEYKNADVIKEKSEINSFSSFESKIDRGNYFYIVKIVYLEKKNIFFIINK